MNLDFGSSEKRSRRWVIILLIFMTIGIILFFIWNYDIFRSNLPQCYWENTGESHSTRTYITSSESAKQEIIEYFDISEEDKNITIEQISLDYWHIKLLRNETVERQYGINSQGRINIYEEICHETNETIGESISEMLDMLTNLTNTTQEIY